MALYIQKSERAPRESSVTKSAWPIFNILCAAAVALSATISADNASAQAYPDKTVRLITDSAAGSGNDGNARAIADGLSRLWGQQVVLLNQPGAGGSVSARTVMTSPPDGYTLYVSGNSPFMALPGASSSATNLPIELPRDMEAISHVCRQPMFIGASPLSGIKTVTDLVEKAKQKPGELSYAATGVGRITHLTMELLQSRTDIKLQLVPYTGGGAQAMGDVISGRVPLIVEGYLGIAGAIQSGQIQGVAATSTKRVPGFPNLPVVAETVPGFYVGADAFLLAPKGTPKPIIDKINADLRKVLDDPEVHKRLDGNACTAEHKTPQGLIDFIQSEQKTWRPILEKVAREAKK